MSRFILAVLSWVWGGLFFYLNGWLLVFGRVDLDHWEWLIAVISGLVVGLVLLLKLIIRSSWRSSDFWLLITPVCFFQLTANLFLLFLEGESEQTIFLAIAALALSLYLYNLWVFYWQPERYQAFTLLNFSWYLHISSLFMVAVVWYGILVILHFSIYLIMVAAIVVLSIVFIQLWRMEKLSFDSNFWRFYLLLLVVGIEAMVVISFLPVSFFLLGLLWVEVVYLTMRIIFDVVNKNVNERRIVYLASIFLLVSALLLATTRWL